MIPTAGGAGPNAVHLDLQARPKLGRDERPVEAANGQRTPEDRGRPHEDAVGKDRRQECDTCGCVRLCWQGDCGEGDAKERDTEDQDQGTPDRGVEEAERSEQKGEDD